jgi:predicted DsbA family dithiol-disulfide isomerase
MRIDFVSDVNCPWCAIGVNALERALERVGGAPPVDLHFQPFEIAPDIPPDGVMLRSYLSTRLGMDEVQIHNANAMLKQRGAAVGFNFGERSRIWNTFDAHRLLRWADEACAPGSQRRLKLALMRAYHGEGRNPGCWDVLLQLVRELGLDVERARSVLVGGAHAAEVRKAEASYVHLGVHAVPTMVIDRQHAVPGVQSVDTLERLLRQGVPGHSGEAPQNH